MTISEKLKAGGKPSSTLKVSQFLGRSIGKKRSSSKRKSGLHDRGQSLKKLESSIIDGSCCSKIGLMSHEGTAGGSSPSESADGKKKLHTATEDIEKIYDSSAAGRKSNYLVEHNCSLPMHACTEPKSEATKKRHDFANKSHSTTNNSTPAPGVVSEAHKRKQKPCKDGSKKKSKMSTGEPSVNRGQKRKSNAHVSSPKIKKPQRKRRSVHHRFHVSQDNAVSGKTESQQEEVS